MREWMCAFVFLSVACGTAEPATYDVPGDYPTIQSAVDVCAPGGGDSVLVAPGTYPEDVVVEAKIVAVIGRGDPTQTIVRSFSWPNPNQAHTHGGILRRVTVGESLVANGLSADYTLSRCVLAGDVDLFVTGNAQMCTLKADSCLFLAGVQFAANAEVGSQGVVITNCIYDSDADAGGGTFTYGRIQNCTLNGNGDISLYTYLGATVGSNILHGSGSIDAYTNYGGEVTVEANTVTTGGIRADVGYGPPMQVTVVGNVIGPGGAGIHVGDPYQRPQYCEVLRNVLITCTEGIVLEKRFGRIASNSVNGCASAGIAAILPNGYSATIERNIASDNAVGVRVVGTINTAGIACNDVWRNTQGNWQGVGNMEGQNGNFAANPRFCDAPNSDLSLNSDSPCLPDNHPDGAACGLVGALPEGCLAPASVGAARGSAALAIFELGPNPASGSEDVSFAVRSGAPGILEVVVHSCDGRIVQRLYKGRTNAGMSRFVWNGTDRFGRRVPAGAYFIRAAEDRSSASAHLVVIR